MVADAWAAGGGYSDASEDPQAGHAAGQDAAGQDAGGADALEQRVIGSFSYLVLAPDQSLIGWPPLPLEHAGAAHRESVAHLQG